MSDKKETLADTAKKARRVMFEVIDARIQRVLDGEEEWPALQQYVDSRIEAYLAQRGTEE